MTPPALNVDARRVERIYIFLRFRSNSRVFVVRRAPLCVLQEAADLIWAYISLAATRISRFCCLWFYSRSLSRSPRNIS